MAVAVNITDGGTLGIDGNRRHADGLNGGQLQLVSGTASMKKNAEQG